MSEKGAWGWRISGAGLGARRWPGCVARAAGASRPSRPKRRCRRSPRTSRRFSRRSARRVTGPIRSRRCRSQTYRADAAVRQLDQEPRRHPPDAAMASRQERRHSEVQERSLALRQGNRHHRPLDRRRRAEGRPEGHAGGREVAGRSGLELRRACTGRRNRILSSSPRRGRRRRARRTRGGSRSSRPASPKPRWVRAIEIRPVDGQGPQDHASRDRAIQQDERLLRPRFAIRTRRSRLTLPAAAAARAAAAPSWNGPSASRAKSCGRTPAS